MNEMPPYEDKPISPWAVAGGLVVFAALFLLWAMGFDALSRWLRGGVIEQVLNWLSYAYWWLSIVGVVLGLVCGKLFGRGS